MCLRWKDNAVRIATANLWFICGLNMINNPSFAFVSISIKHNIRVNSTPPWGVEGGL